MTDDRPDFSGSPRVGDDGGGCQFPTGPDGATCGRPLERSGTPGRPSRYCDLAEHTRAKAFTVRRNLERVPAAGSGIGLDAVTEGLSQERPVSAGRASFGALLARFEDVAAQAGRVAAEQQTQLAGILAAATEVVRTVADPDAASYEVEQVQRETGVRVAEAESAQAAAEREAREHRRRAEREAEQRAQADEAAEEALAALEQVRHDTAETVAAITERADAAVAEHQRRADEAATERDAAVQEQQRVQAEAAEQIAGAHSAADTARREANTQVLAVRQQLAEANSAQTKAEAERAAAERRAAEEKQAVTGLRAEIERLRIAHQEELAETRREAAAERAALRQEGTEQLREVLARFDAHAAPGDASTSSPARRTRGARTD